METFGSCHCVIDRNPLGIVGTLVTVYMLIFFRWRSTSTTFLKWTSPILLAIMLILGSFHFCNSVQYKVLLAH